jgi:predicted transglutaminase-like cysteine proteinase
VVSTVKALVERVFIIGVSLSAAACASAPPISTTMPLGFAATPPRAYVDFCERTPAECNVSGPELAEMRLQANNAAATAAAVSAIAYDWSAAFKLPAKAALAAQTPAEPARAAEAQPATYDWSAVFAKAKADGELAAISANTVSGVTVTPLRPGAPALLPMTRETWALLMRVNDSVNRAIVPQEDIATYGVSDYWAEPLESGVRYGDCEDYVLEKRHALAAAGVPASALSIAVVQTDRGETHAVLVVATSTGEYVLDNRTPWILPWAQTSYRWRERQVAGSASQWAFAAAAPSSQPDARFLIASAR